MPTCLFLCENGGNGLYSVGRVGFDSGSQDAGGVYTAKLRSERFSPAGEGGLVLFRRVVVRFFHTGSVSGKLRVYVDDAQTQYYLNGVLTNQEVSFSIAAPTTSPDEALVEMDIEVRGTWIQVEGDIDSDEFTGLVLPETYWVGFRRIRAGRQENAAVT